MADEGKAVEEGTSLAQSPLVTVSFQKDPKRREKYLEAEPKALGITQIFLSVYEMIGVIVLEVKDGYFSPVKIPLIITSLVIICSGFVAIKAKDLSFSKLRACLGIQVFACIACIVNIIYTSIEMAHSYFECYHGYYLFTNAERDTDMKWEICLQAENINMHYRAGVLLIQFTLIAISVSLFTYCCKVVNCCGPAPKMSVIMIQSPPVQEREDERTLQS